MSKRPRGRPPKIDEINPLDTEEPKRTRSECIIADVRAGVPAETAAQRAGVSTSAYYEWASREEPRYVEFAEAIQVARAHAEAQAVANIRIAARNDWRAEAWFLERTRPRQYGRNVIEHTGPGGGPIRVESRSIEAILVADNREQVRDELLDKYAGVDVEPSGNGHGALPSGER